MPLSPPFAQRLETWLVQLSHFPWRTTAHMLRERFREDRLGITASSLTFTTLLALVPFFTVALAVFAAFPIFGKMEQMLQRWLIDSLVPDSISRPVLGYLTQFSAKASGLGVAGFSVLMLTALALILTIDRTLNTIWRVRRLRPLGQRVLIYWAAITLGPLVLAASLALSASIAGAASRGLGATLPGGARLLLDAIEFLLLAAGVAAMYRYVPNTQVHWRDAWAGSLFVSVGMELAKKGLGLYLASVPTYSVIYGTFATLPILLLWIYVAWVIVLLGAVVAAYLPSLLAGVARHAGGQGWPFLLAVEALQQLHGARGQAAHGLTAVQLAQLLRVDVLQLEPVLDALKGLDWVVQVNEAAAGAPDSVDARYLLLADPATTHMEPLVQRLLLTRSAPLARFWAHTGLEVLRLADVLEPPVALGVMSDELLKK
ncbi:YihY family inner membrane protein [Alicycliphilus denitrificans]|uniref:YihY family inner membrane protein n=1 Tax=Alicycliphilus denitrificans TaxID=179636 RepID=UPI00384CEF06